MIITWTTAEGKFGICILYYGLVVNNRSKNCLFIEKKITGKMDNDDITHNKNDHIFFKIDT